MKKRVCLDNYTIIINPSFELGVDYTIIDSFNGRIISCNCNYFDSFASLNDLFKHIIDLIFDYEKSMEKEKIKF